jgi:molybdopterin-dependent oxidoreductase alpha subunit
LREKWIDPSLWVSLKPFGVGEQHPNSYVDIVNAISENRDQLAYAWRILNHGVCDGCSLGTSGMRDWTLDEIHLCNVRLRLLRLNTMPALDVAELADVAALRRRTGEELRALGRLPYPMIRRRGERGFRRVGWDEALGLVADRIRRSSAGRLGFYLTSRGQPNENYYAAQKAVRAMGTNSIDNAARLCHSPSTFGLKYSLGVAATTCSYRDWIGSDLVVFIGSNVAANQPVAMKYLYHAKKAGTKVVVVNTYREPAMERYWVPSNWESALFGTRIADRFFLVDAGGDVGFLNGVLKHMIEQGWVDQRFIEDHTVGYDEVGAALGRQSWEKLERAAGVSRGEMRQLAAMLGQADTAVFVWSMGITQHEFGEANVLAIINLALTKGFVGRPGCGLMPIRGHSGVQGGAEMGAYATTFPGGIPVSEENATQFSELWGFEVPGATGLTTGDMLDAAHVRALDVLFQCGGNLAEVLPDAAYAQQALERIPLRVHMDIVMSTQMLLDPADTVVLLPATTRYEIPGGVTETTTERRVIFSPEIPGPRIGEARPEWRVLTELAQRVHPEIADLVRFDDTAAIREDIARTIPSYALIRHLKREADQFQYGGPHLCWGWNFPTADGKAHFSAVEPPETEVPEGMFTVATRRGKQFNSMVQGARDGHTGATRDAILISRDDADVLGVEDGDQLLLRSQVGQFRGRALLAPVKPRSLQIHWPEGEVLIDHLHRSRAGVPDYNALVTLSRVDSDQAGSPPAEAKAGSLPGEPSAAAPAALASSPIGDTDHHSEG